MPAARHGELLLGAESLENAHLLRVGWSAVLAAGRW
jgi:hypothetical protein